MPTATKRSTAPAKPAKPAPAKPSAVPAKAAAKANGSKPKPSLPATLANSLPVAVDIMKNMAMVEALIPQVEKELAKSKKAGAIATARSFVVLHRLIARIDEIIAPLNAVFKQYKELECPSLFEQEGITNVPLAEGFRVGLSARLFASIVPEKRSEAYQWLRENGLADLIQATVNSQTLSAAAKNMLEEKNVQLPDDLFKTVLVPNTSVTAVATK